MTDHIEKTKQMIAVMQAYVDGKPIESVLTGLIAPEPQWNWSGNEYRIATTPDTIDWSHVAPEWKYMARDEDGRNFLYTAKPKIEGDVWVVDGGDAYRATALASLRRGTYDWKDSLVRRPE